MILFTLLIWPGMKCSKSHGYRWVSVWGWEKKKKKTTVTLWRAPVLFLKLYFINIRWSQVIFHHSVRTIFIIKVNHYTLTVRVVVCWCRLLFRLPDKNFKSSIHFFLRVWKWNPVDTYEIWNAQFKRRLKKNVNTAKTLTSQFIKYA